MLSATRSGAKADVSPFADSDDAQLSRVPPQRVVDRRRRSELDKRSHDHVLVPHPFRLLRRDYERRGSRSSQAVRRFLVCSSGPP